MVLCAFICPSVFKITEQLMIYLFGVLRRFQHCTGHITTGSWKGRGNQYIQFVRVLYCKLLINSKQLPAFPLEAVTGIEPRPQSWGRECYHSATVAPEQLMNTYLSGNFLVWVGPIQRKKLLHFPRHT